VSEGGRTPSWHLAAPDNAQTQGLVVSGFAALPTGRALFLELGWKGVKKKGGGAWLEALRKVDGVPVSRSTSWFPGDRFAGIAEAYRRSESITKAFAELGLADYIRTSTEISATHAEPSEITDLELSPGAIVLVTKAQNTDLDGVPVQYAITRFPADRVHFTIEN